MCSGTCTVLLSTAHCHTRDALARGWTLPDLEPLVLSDDNETQHHLPGASPCAYQPVERKPIPLPFVMKAVSPFWLRRPPISTENNTKWIDADRKGIQNDNVTTSEVANDFFCPSACASSDFPSISATSDLQLAGMILLTAPNMSGKSTLIRSCLTVALLANCGLLVPCSYASVPRFDGFFVREGGRDAPVEGQSHFGVEMEDTRIILRDATARSLIMFDELGRGTSPTDGTAIAGAILEALDRVRCCGIFSTHFHQLFDLDLKLCHVTEMRMETSQGDDYSSKEGMSSSSAGNQSSGFRTDDGTRIRKEFTQRNFKVVPGRCTDSLALVTAKQFEIPGTIIQRAQALKDAVECRRVNRQLSH